MDHIRDTIYALSSAPGRAGVAVVRLTGPQAVDILRKITRFSLPAARKMGVRRLYDVSNVIDEAMVVWFEDGASYTSEQMVELHLHGGRATVSAALSMLADIGGLRAAEPGEFTRRAMEAGRMDLVEVEALADLINAETEEQRKQALSLMVGDGRAKAREWRDMFAHALALLEASIDFADEEDAPDDVAATVSELMGTLQSELADAINGSKTAASVRDGFRIALVGSPNAGKSTLMNALAKRQAAITSPYAGTTRDVIEVSCDFDGFPVVLQDMAGLREADDPVEQIGVSWALETAKRADLRLFLESKDAPLGDIDDLQKPGDIRLQTKSDLHPVKEGCAISAVTGDGLGDLIRRIVCLVADKSGSSAIFARDRQVECLRTAHQQLTAAFEVGEPELMVEHLRGGVAAMNHLFGDIETEEILGRIFSQFCIGK